jgi:hypothetical protein
MQTMPVRRAETPEKEVDRRREIIITGSPQIKNTMGNLPRRHRETARFLSGMTFLILTRFRSTVRVIEEVIAPGCAHPIRHDFLPSRMERASDYPP